MPLGGGGGGVIKKKKKKFLMKAHPNSVGRVVGQTYIIFSSIIYK